MEKQLVVFDLFNEHYGVDIGAVESIVKLPHVTSVPRAPAFVKGVINLRGAVLPVIDLRERFGLPAGETSTDTRIVVVEMNGLNVGMVVDAVTEVLRVPQANIEPPPALVVTADSTFITGIAKVGERLIILLELARVLNVEEQSELQALELIRDEGLEPAERAAPAKD